MKTSANNSVLDELGQLIITGISGYTLTKEEKDFLQKENIGGVILFTHNYQAPAQLAELINSIQALRSEYPLFICVDFEGGRVKRFKTHFTQWPSMQSVARLNSPKIIFELHSMLSLELKAVGINWNFSPVCDILQDKTSSAIGDRSFGYDPELVGQGISAAIRGMLSHKMICSAKHYPGHGSSEVDSHLQLPILHKSLEDLEHFDLIPFHKAAKSKVETIMVGHLLLEKMDPKFCASMSEKIITYLRDSLRFNRIIVSDDLEMQAITNTYGKEIVPILGINAGNNLLIYRTQEYAQYAVENLKQAYRKKELDPHKVQESLRMIYLTKDYYLSDYQATDISSLGDFSSIVGCKKHSEFLKDLLEKLSALGH